MRQIGVLVGSYLILAVTWAFVPWLGKARRGHWLSVGALWALLTFAFEIGLGRVLGFDWARILADYNPARGGFMPAGLVVVVADPLVAARLRGLVA